MALLDGADNSEQARSTTEECMNDADLRSRERGYTAYTGVSNQRQGGRDEQE